MIDTPNKYSLIWRSGVSVPFAMPRCSLSVLEPPFLLRIALVILPRGNVELYAVVGFVHKIVLVTVCGRRNAICGVYVTRTSE